MFFHIKLKVINFSKINYTVTSENNFAYLDGVINYAVINKLLIIFFSLEFSISVTLKLRKEFSFFEFSDPFKKNGDGNNGAHSLRSSNGYDE